MRSVLVVACLIFLPSGCTQPDGSTALGVPGSPAWMATASPEAKLATYRANCTGYGYLPGTPEMARCVQHESGDYRDNASSAMSAMAEGMAEMNKPSPIITTHCSGYGNSVNCTSY